MPQFEPKSFLVSMIVVILSIALHEFGHAISADKLGDPTPRRQGRVTLWPDKHFDIAGFVMIILTSIAGRGIGWGKPVEVNPRNFRNPRRDMFIVAICGPLMNLLLAMIFGLILRVIIMTHQAGSLYTPDAADYSTLGMFLMYFVDINLALMFFNLIPVHPLDGSKLLGSLLPPAQAAAYDRTVGPYGYMIIVFFAFAFPGAISHLIYPAVDNVWRHC